MGVTRFVNGNIDHLDVVADFAKDGDVGGIGVVVVGVVISSLMSERSVNV